MHCQGTLAVCNTIYRYMYQLREVFLWCRNYFILKAYSMVTVVHKKDTIEYAHYAISVKRWLVHSILLILIVFKQVKSVFVWPQNWSSDSKNKIFKIQQCIFSILPLYIHGKGHIVLNLNKLKTSLPNDTLCQIWLKFT